MILVQHRDRMLDVKVLGSVPAPGDLGDPVQVVSGHVELACGRFEGGELLDLLVEYFLHGFRHREFRGAFFEFLNELVFSVAVDPEFLFDPLELFHQKVLLLLSCDLLVDFLGDFLLELGVGEFFFDDVEGLVETLFDDHGFEDRLQFRGLGG